MKRKADGMAPAAQNTQNADKRQGAQKKQNADKRQGVQKKQKVLVLASVASMIDQFNLPNIRLMQELGLEVHVACNFRKGNTCDKSRLKELQKKLQAMQVVIHQWDCPRSIRSVSGCIRAYRSLLALMQAHHFSWMHCQSPIGGALARVAAHKKQVRAVYTAHGFHFYKGAPLLNWLLYYPVEKLLAHWTEVLLTVNQEDYQLAKCSMKAHRVCYIPGVGIDSGRFLECSHDAERAAFCRKYRIPEDAVILLSVGELSKRKNHRAVLYALAQMKDKHVYYLVCGQGKLKNRLYQQAKLLGIQKQVRFAGFQKDVQRMYRNADIFVFPSIQEGLPAALMEAMAAGMACVVSDIRGNRDLVDDAGGIRFPLKRHRKNRCSKEETSKTMPSKAQGCVTLREALTLLCSDKKLRQEFGAYNQQKIKSYDWRNVSGKMRRIYTDMKKNGADVLSKQK